ncbi:MAG: hypothetical protein U0804_24240 [Gemmataceae bacterium]
MRTLLALVLLSPVALGQDEDPVPVAPPPRLKAAPTAKKAPPRVDTTLPVEPKPKPVVKAEPTPVPMPAPKTNPVPEPEPAPKPVAKAEPPAPKPAPVEPKAEPKADEKTDAKSEAKDDKPASTTPPVVKFPEPAFNDYQLPLYAIMVVGGVAVLVVLRSYIFPPKA